MPEPLDQSIRRRMQQQRRRDTALELAIRRSLHARGHRYRVDYRLEPTLRTRGDIVFTRRKVVVFVDGCFWHGCPEHATAPKNNAAWWRDKLQTNVQRDRRVDAQLAELGWVVVRVWEHEEHGDAIGKVEAAIQSSERDRRA